MTLYSRPRAEVFADNAPPSEIQPFQAWLRGLGIAFDETNGFPEMTGLNGLFNALNQYIKYLEQNGFAEWSSSLEYPVGAGVRVGSIWYRARTRNTNKPPATSQNDWAVFLNGADVASASTTVKGIVQLSNVLNSTSTSLALTAAQGKKLQDEKLDKSGGTVTGTLAVNGPLRSKQYIDLGYGESSDANRTIVFYSTGTSKKGQITSTTSGAMEFTGATSYSFDKTVNADISGNAASATNASNVSRSIVAGNGLSGGGVLNANRTLTLGTPSTVTASTTNSTTSTSHTHNLDVNSLPLLGVGQSWQVGGRALGTTYTNDTGRPIMVVVSISDTTAGGLSVTVGGVAIISTGADLQPGLYPISFIVPNGMSYRVVSAGNYLQRWAELR